MDIIIRNGVIQKTETTKKYNKEEVLKIPWNEYHNNKPGPYYDPENNHLCIFRKPHLIKNFTGPQNPALKKFIIININLIPVIVLFVMRTKIYI